MIKEFRDEYRFLSNFWPSVIGIKDRWGNKRIAKTVEHAYQAAKATNEKDYNYVLDAGMAGDAKRRGNAIKLRRDWESVKLDIMEQLLRIKFSNPELRDRLLSTGDEELVEGNHWHDTFFGVCNCPRCKGKGQNHLGKSLMKIRTEIRIQSERIQR
jgi:ribA/ribD-fused uncharacterized protein